MNFWTSDIEEFIQAHVGENVRELAFAKNPFPEVPYSWLLHQVKSRTTLLQKVPSWVSSSGLIFPEGVALEQTSSEETARYKAGLIRGESLVDLTGGLGVDSYFFAQNFEKVQVLERNKTIHECAVNNLKCLNENKVQRENLDAITWLTTAEGSPEWYYLDPARRSDANKKLVSIQDYEPNIVELWPWLANGHSRLMIKLSPMLDIDLAMKELPGTREVLAIAVRNELKELVFIVEPQFTGEVTFRAVNLVEGKAEELTTQNRSRHTGTVDNFTYIYQPNVALMKLGLFEELGRVYGVGKIHPNTNIFAADERIHQFPGKGFELVARLKVGAKEVRKAGVPAKVNIVSKNFPLTPEQLYKKLKLQPGGEDFLFAVTAGPKNEKRLLWGRRFL